MLLDLVKLALRPHHQTHHQRLRPLALHHPAGTSVEVAEAEVTVATYHQLATEVTVAIPVPSELVAPMVLLQVTAQVPS